MAIKLRELACATNQGFSRAVSGLSIDDLLIATLIAIHGPIDMGVTAAFFHLETNPLVIGMGLWPWLAFKVALITALSILYLSIEFDSGIPRPGRALLAVIGLGSGVLVLLNPVVILLA